VLFRLASFIYFGEKLCKIKKVAIPMGLFHSCVGMKALSENLIIIIFQHISLYNVPIVRLVCKAWEEISIHNYIGEVIGKIEISQRHRLIKNRYCTPSCEIYVRGKLVSPSIQWPREVLQTLLCKKVIDPNFEIHSRHLSLTTTTLLAEASAHGCTDTALSLLQSRADIDHSVDVLWSNMTPMHLAIVNKRTEIVKILISFKCDVTSQTNDHKTSIHLAATWLSDVETIQNIVDAKADINATDKSRRTALHYAAGQLHHAAGQESTSVLRFLIDCKCTYSSDFLGYTPLHIASQEGSDVAVRFLLETKCDPNARSVSGCSALHDTTTLASVSSLVEFGAIVNMRSYSGFIPLHCAVLRSDKSIIKFLLDRGSEVNCTDSFGSTPLHWAAMKGKLSNIETLLVAKAEANIENSIGNTALHYALNSNIGRQMELILARFS